MLLGHDIMQHLGVLHDMKSDTLVVNGERVPVIAHLQDKKPVVARVSLTKRVVVRPNSVVRVACILDDQLGDYYLEPGNLIHQKKVHVLMPYTGRSASDSPIICLVNPTNNFKTLKKNEIIANAHEIDIILGDMNSANTRMASSQSSGSNCVAASSPTKLKHGARSVAASSPANLSHRSRSVAASSPTEVSKGSKPVAASSPTGKAQRSQISQSCGF